MPWKYAVPAAIAGGAYLEAKFLVRKDLRMISNIFIVAARLKKYQTKDQLNAFYVLEEQAHNPSVANKVLLIFEGRRYTFREAYENVLRYGQWLKSDHGVVQGEIVAMDITNKPEFLWIAYGLLSLGAKPAFINHNLGGEALLHCVRTSTARLLLVDEDVEHHLTTDVRTALHDPSFRSGGKGATEIAVFGVKTAIRVAAFDPIREPDSVRANQSPQDIAVLIYTSGTTGFPKAATVSWQKVVGCNAYMPRLLQMRPEDRFYTGMPLYHSAAFLLGWTNCVASGATLVLSRKFSLTKFWPEVHESGATIIQYVGETLRYLLSAPPSKLDKGHKVRLAYGNGLRPDIWNEFKTRFDIPTVSEFYGATEAPGTLHNHSSNSFTEGAIGHVGPLLRLLFGGRSAFVVLDPETDEPLRDPKTGFARQTDRAAGEVGEYLNVLPENWEENFQGYFGNSEASHKKIIKDVFKKGDLWYRSGDVMRVDTEGRAYFVDRIGDTFRWKSENVSTFEVQEAIGRHGAVADSTVYGVELPKHDGRAGCGALVLKEGQQANDAFLESLSQHLTRSLPGYARPLFLRITPELERTGTGKHVKTGLRKAGVDPEKSSDSGDKFYWLRNGVYVPFTDAHWRQIQGGAVKL